MKLGLFVLFLLLMQIAALAQTLPEWFRVHTFDDKSIVELNTNYVMFSTTKTERVRFRWIYDKPQNLSRDSKIQYHSILQEIAFDCRNNKYRIYETKYFDADEKLIQTVSPKETGEWKAVYSGKIIGKLFSQACKLIELRKREPALEP
jgi:hypothetical protein